MQGSDQAVNSGAFPLRVGVNGGSLERPLLDGMAGLPRSPVESALNAVHALGDEGFTNMKVSLKASDVHHAIDAYYLFSPSPIIPCMYRHYQSPAPPVTGRG